MSCTQTWKLLKISDNLPFLRGFLHQNKWNRKRKKRQPIYFLSAFDVTNCDVKGLLFTTVTTCVSSLAIQRWKDSQFQCYDIDINDIKANLKQPYIDKLTVFVGQCSCAKWAAELACMKDLLKHPKASCSKLD